eukprot:jgi/Hompol1/5220/HPOL_000698-RA
MPPARTKTLPNPPSPANVARSKRQRPSLQPSQTQLGSAAAAAAAEQMLTAAQELRATSSSAFRSIHTSLAATTPSPTSKNANRDTLVQGDPFTQWSEIEDALVSQARELQFKLAFELNARSELESQASAMQATIDKLERECKALRSKNASDTDRTWALEVESSDLKIQNGKLSAQLFKLQRDAQSLRLAINEQKELLEASSQREIDLKREIESLRTQLVNARRAVRDALHDASENREFSSAESPAKMKPFVNCDQLASSDNSVAHTSDQTLASTTDERSSHSSSQMNVATSFKRFLPTSDSIARSFTARKQPRQSTSISGQILALEQTQLELMDAHSRIKDLTQQEAVLADRCHELEQMLSRVQEDLVLAQSQRLEESIPSQTSLARILQFCDTGTITDSVIVAHQHIQTHSIEYQDVATEYSAADTADAKQDLDIQSLDESDRFDETTSYFGSSRHDAWSAARAESIAPSSHVEKGESATECLIATMIGSYVSALRFCL